MTRFLLSLAMCFIGYVGISQITVDPPEPVGEGISSEAAIHAENFFVNNGSTAPVDFLWRAEVVSMPSNWRIQICDTNLCYDWGQLECPPNNPNTLPVNDPKLMQISAQPNGQTGVGDIDLILFDVADPSNIYATIPVTLTTTSNTADVSKKFDEIAIFPNPAISQFSLDNDEGIEKIVVYNIIGKEVKNFDKDAANAYPVSDLRNGMYLVRLFDEQGEAVKVLRLSKR